MRCKRLVYICKRGSAGHTDRVMHVSTTTTTTTCVNNDVSRQRQTKQHIDTQDNSFSKELGTRSEFTIGKRKVEMILVVVQELVGGGVHGEQSERWVAPAVWSDRRTDQHSPIHTFSVLDLMKNELEILVKCWHNSVKELS